MEKLLNSYECMYIIDAAADEEKTKGLIENFKNLVTEEKGELENVDEWGKRRLAYEIDHKTEGYYVLMTFKSDPAFPAELSRVMGITDGILRCLITCR